MSAAAGSPRVIVLVWKSANSWPKPQNKVRVLLCTIEEALKTTWRTDAHFQPIATTVARRLNNGAVGHVPIAISVLIGDIDDPVAHRMKTPARVQWREEQERKFQALRDRHPGVFIYSTNGGYRIVFALAEPFTIGSTDDRFAWWSAYLAFARYLRVEFGLCTDVKCKDFGHLYRAPRVLRDGVPQQPVTHGDPTNLERLDLRKIMTNYAGSHTHPFVRAALRKAVEAVRTAAEGARNETLNREAFALGGFIPGGYLDETDLADALLDAILKNGGDETKDAKKIADAIEAGKAQPREPPTRSAKGAPSTSPDGVGAQPAPSACAAARENAKGDGGTTDDGRPIIHHQPSRYQPDVLASVEVLGAAGGVYVNGPRLVHIVRASTRQQRASRWTSSDGRTRFDVVAGSPLIARLPQSVLKMQLSEAALFKKFVFSRGGWVNCAPPDDVIAAVHELGSWDLPRINGVAETPIFRADGSIADTDGYDEQTGYWIELNAKFPSIPVRPSKDEARAAYLALAEPFADFPYVRPEQVSVSIAAILTVMAAPAIKGSRPGIVYDASAGGTGKTLSTDAVAKVTTGRPASRKAYPATDEECEKALAAYALRGSPLISMDDIKRPLGGENLDRVLTARRDVDFRRLGKTDLVTMPWVATLLFTGVNITFSGQMARRVLVSRIESRLERPQDRQDFKHPELLSWITAERPRLVAAALTLLRAFAVAGYPGAGLKRWGSFEEWSRLIPPAIVFAGGPDVLGCRPSDDDEDAVADVALLRSVLSGLETLCNTEAPGKERKPEEGLTSGEIVAALYCRPPPFERAKQLLGVALRELIGAQIADPSAQAVGTHLAKYKGRPLKVGERLLRLVKIKDTTKAAGDRWAVEVVTP